MIPIETSEERIQLAIDTLNNLEIVKKCRSNPELVEHEAYAYFNESQKKHSLTCSVSFEIDRAGKRKLNDMLDIKRT